NIITGTGGPVAPVAPGPPVKPSSIRSPRLGRQTMRATTDPNRVDHPVLRELALAAAWVARLEDAVDVLEDLVGDFDDDRLPNGAEPTDAAVGEAAHVQDPLAVALGVVEERYEEEDRELEGRLIAWLAEDPEHWPIFRMVVLDPWQGRPGVWR